MQKIVDETVASLKPIIEDFLKMLNYFGYELDDNADIVPIKDSSRILERRDRFKDE